MTSDELMPGITVRQATPDDADALLALYREAAHWLLARGIDQWQPQQFKIELLLESIARGEVYVAVRASTREPVGVLTLTWADARIWGAQPPDVGYVHRLAVRRSAAGQGIGAALLAWAERQIGAGGRAFARLDCVAENPALRAYYERAGYTLVDVVRHDGGGLARFEKRVDSMTASETTPTRYGTLTIRSAGPDDVDAMSAIDESVSAWLESRGIDAGPRPTPPQAMTAERAGDGTRWLALLDGRPAGMMRLLWQPEAMWADLPGDAAYVHGLLVHRDFAGKEIGRRLLEWAERRASAAGKPLVRLDCVAENPALRAYYERAGYTHRGDVAQPHRTDARYEKTLAAADMHSPSPCGARGSGGEDTL